MTTYSTTIRYNADERNHAQVFHDLLVAAAGNVGDRYERQVETSPAPWPAGSDRDDGLTDAEGVVMDGLVQAANAFAKLPQQHRSDLGDFVDSIHRCQDLLAVRIARRAFPSGWTNWEQPPPSLPPTDRTRGI